MDYSSHTELIDYSPKGEYEKGLDSNIHSKYVYGVAIWKVYKSPGPLPERGDKP